MTKLLERVSAARSAVRELLRNGEVWTLRFAHWCELLDEVERGGFQLT
jgi:hypothetical protein